MQRRPRDPDWRPKCYDCGRVGVELHAHFRHLLCAECYYVRLGYEQTTLDVEEP